MIGVYDYTVIATYLASILGLFGVFMAIDGQVLPAIFCLLLSGLLDSVDGRIARTKKNRSEQEKRFGIQIDSLNDLICFGVLPAATGYCLCRGWTDGNVPVLISASLCFFMLTGLIRLAFFNVTEEERQQTSGDKRKYYLGLPITSSTLIFPFLYLLTLLLPNARLAILTVGMVINGLLFITPLHIKKPRLAGIIIMSCIGAAELAGLILVMLRVL
ncbi:MAG: CDP-alcohol phosphatidyltransferase family protein [Eubacteriales bacterium]|nr:CDP-alcohol phosphatidyltransferase family protein [Eubacteriales bacterium]